MPELVYGLGTEAGVQVGGEMRQAGVVDGVQLVFDVELAPTVQAAQGWWFEIPEGTMLVSVVSFGVETTAQWTVGRNDRRYQYFFGVVGVGNRISVRVTNPGELLSVSQGEEVIDAAVVGYAPVVFTADEQAAVVGYLRSAIRVSESPENDRRLFDLLKASIREVETYCNHALIRRTFTSRSLYSGGLDGPILFSVNGRWRALQSLTSVTTSGSAVVTEGNGHFYGRPGLLYRAEFVLGPFDGPESGLGDDVLDSLARLVGYRWDGGIFQRSALWQSGCLDSVSRYVNREAAIL